MTGPITNQLDYHGSGKFDGNTLGTEWITEWNGWACWMHEKNDQKINMGMSTAKGSICKASDMVDRIHVTDNGYSGSTSTCKKSGFVLEILSTMTDFINLP